VVQGEIDLAALGIPLALVAVGPAILTRHAPSGRADLRDFGTRPLAPAGGGLGCCCCPPAAGSAQERIDCRSMVLTVVIQPS